MSRTIEAEYIAEEKVLKLTEPLAGVRNHEMVRVTVDGAVATERGDWPTVREEGGRDLARAVREAFGRDIAVERLAFDVNAAIDSLRPTRPFPLGTAILLRFRNVSRFPVRRRDAAVPAGGTPAFRSRESKSSYVDK